MEDNHNFFADGVLVSNSQCIKNPLANATKVLINFGKLAARRYIATGTPVAERPDDLYSQIYFLDHGKLLGASHYAFMETYCVFGSSPRMPGRRWVVKYKNLLHLKGLVDQISIRRLKDDCLDLPPKVFNVQHMQADPPQARLLSTIRSSILATLRNAQGRTINLTNDQSGLSGRIQSMMRATACPWLVDASVTKSAKLDELMDTLDELGDRQLIVWTSHRDVCEATCTYLNGHKISALFINGDVPQKERDLRLTAFRDGQTRVLVATMATLREAVTLTNCAHAFYLQLDFLRTNYTQSQDRIHRIGTKGACVYHIPLIDHTSDVYIHNTLERKDAAAQTALDGKHVTALDVRAFINALGGDR